MLGRDPRLLALQGRLIAAVAPFAAPKGTGAAFVTDPEEPGINATTIAYVARFVPDHCASNYEAHLSIGMARRGDLEAVEAEPFEPFDVRAEAVAVYQLGNNGTARRRLRAWPVAEGKRARPGADAEDAEGRGGIAAPALGRSGLFAGSVRPVAARVVLRLRLVLRLRRERAVLHLLHHADGGVDRDGEADALVAAGLRVDLLVDADHFAVGVEQRAAGVAGVDRGVGLDAAGDGGAVGRLQLAVGRGDDAAREREVEAERVADGDDFLADGDLGRVAELDGRERRAPGSGRS